LSDKTINTTIITSYTLRGTALTITNTGEIDAASVTTAISNGQQGADAVYVPKSLTSGMVQNAGTLIGGNGPTEGGGAGVYLYGHDQMLNSGFVVGGYSTGFNGGGTGVYLAAQEGASLTNTGTIAGGNGEKFGGTGLVVGSVGNFQFYPQDFSANSTLAAEVTNSGLIVGGTGESQQSGSFGGGGGTGVFLGEGTLDNEGIILGGSSRQAGGYGISVFGTFGATLINDGTISGGHDSGGTITDAIMFNAATVASTLVADPGAVFIGAVVVAGTAPDTLLLGTGTKQTAGTLDMAGSFSGFNSIAFDPGAAWRLGGTTAELAAGQTISGFSSGDTIVLDGFAATSDSFVTGTGLVLANAAASDTLDLVGSFTTSDFVVSTIGTGTQIELSAPCFGAGTRIATSRGSLPVECLQIGDMVRTANRGFQPIRWIGRRSYDGRFIAGNHLALPVKIRRHALGFNVPSRDLYVSPDHALCEGGVLVQARLLINGVSITQAQSVARVEYFHIALERHEVIFAENTPTESFWDADCVHRFANAADAPPDLPLSPCLPLVQDGYYLARLKACIDARAGIPPAPTLTGPLRGNIDKIGLRLSGWVQDIMAPEVPVELELVCEGQAVCRFLANRYRDDLRNAGLGSGCHAFELKLPPLTGRLTVRRITDGAILGTAQQKAA